MDISHLTRPNRLALIGLVLAVALGTFLRLPSDTFSTGGSLHAIAVLHPQPGFKQVGFDEGLYRSYVDSLIAGGIGSYPDIVDQYREVQKKLPGSILPPMRFLYIGTAYAWHQIFGCDALTALKQVAAFFSILTLFLSALFVCRMKGPAWSAAVTAMLAVAPTQLHMSQHALVDGFFTFWATLALWLFWENLRTLRDWRWLAGYALALMSLVLTKENSFFVWLGIVVLLVANRWLLFGTATRELVAATLLGPILGVVVLVFLAGGVSPMLETYQLSVSKNYQLTYAILTGDGPWHRYIVDILLVSPVIALLVIAKLFQIRFSEKPELFFAVFIVSTYLVMCNVKYGMNLRYANMWDLPLRILAFSMVLAITSRLGRYTLIATVGAIVVICAAELRQYILMFVQFPMYELVSEGLLRALHILKTK